MEDRVTVARTVNSWHALGSVPQSILLIGPSHSGRTTFAELIKKHCFNAPSPGLALCGPDTILCRCEEVTRATVEEAIERELVFHFGAAGGEPGGVVALVGVGPVRGGRVEIALAEGVGDRGGVGEVHGCTCAV